jgi:hypothetical protein
MSPSGLRLVTQHRLWIVSLNTSDPDLFWDRIRAWFFWLDFLKDSLLKKLKQVDVPSKCMITHSTRALLGKGELSGTILDLFIIEGIFPSRDYCSG